MVKNRTQFTPRVFFINPKNERILFDSVGYIKKKKFEQLLNRAIESSKDSL